jgi:tRNA threonylcarbamoyladenosine biosynthesis protein TsaE
MIHASWDYRLDEIGAVAMDFWKVAGAAKIFAFHGDMGAGKTTFIHALCDARGVMDAVGSPTFSLINQYAFPDGGQEGTIYHMDLYRLGGQEEAERAGIEDCLWSGAICFVEWPERAAGLLPPETLRAEIRVTGPLTRHLILTGEADNP